MGAAGAVARLVAAVAVAAVALAGCSPDEAALRQERLTDAVAATLTGPLAFNLSVEAPEEALEGFGDAAGPLAGLLAGSSAAGVIEEDRVAVGLAVGGADVLQVRVTGPGEQYVRFNLGALAGLGGAPQATIGNQLEEALAGTDLDAAARSAVLAAARGEWVQLVPAQDAQDTQDTQGTEALGAGASVGDALAALLRSADPVGHTGDLEADPFDGRLDIELDLDRALAAAAEVLAGIAPASVPTTADSDDTDVLPGRVLIEAGIVRTVVLELGPLATDGQDAPDGAAGEVELVLDLRQLRAGEPYVEPPDAVARVTVAQLERASTVLADLRPPAAP